MLHCIAHLPVSALTYRRMGGEGAPPGIYTTLQCSESASGTGWHCQNCPCLCRRLLAELRAVVEAVRVVLAELAVEVMKAFISETSQ